MRGVYRSATRALAHPRTTAVRCARRRADTEWNSLSARWATREVRSRCIRIRARIG